MISRGRKLLCLIAAFGVAVGSARADGLELSYFVRFGTYDHSWKYFVTVITIIMITNYALNFAVIGLPAILRGLADAKGVALGLVILTILGQVADRIEAFAAFLVAIPISPFISALFPPPFGLDVYSLFAANLICSGVAVGALALWFLRKRWFVSKALSWKIAIAAALLTNPAWILLIPIGMP
jgi:hypothetical protein